VIERRFQLLMLYRVNGARMNVGTTVWHCWNNTDEGKLEYTR